MSFDFDVNVRADQARQTLAAVDDDLLKIEGHATAAGSAIEEMATHVGAAMAAAASAHEVMHMVDTYTEVSNKIRVLTADTVQFNSLMEQTYQIAQDTRMEWEDTAATYQRLSAATQDLNLSQKQMLDLTKELSEGVKISGANSREAGMAMGEIMHAFETGALTGREFKVLMKDTPALMLELRKAAGLTAEQFAEMGKHGQLTAQMLIDTFGKAGPEIHEKFGRTVPTITEMWQQFRQEITKVIGESGIASTVLHAVATGLSTLMTMLKPILQMIGMLAQALDKLANNPIVKAAMTLGAIVASPISSVTSGIFGGSDTPVDPQKYEAFKNQLLGVTDATKVQKDAVDEVGLAAEEMFSKIKNPMANHETDLAALTRLWEEGRISVEVYEKQLKKLGDVSLYDLKKQVDDLNVKIAEGRRIGQSDLPGVAGSLAPMLEAKAKMEADIARREGEEGVKRAKEILAIQERKDRDEKLSRQTGVKIDIPIDVDYAKTHSFGATKLNDAAEIDVLNQEAAAQKKLTEIQEYKASTEYKVYQQIAGPRKEYFKDLRALDNLLQAHMITLTEYNDELQKIEQTFGGFAAMLRAMNGSDVTTVKTAPKSTMDREELQDFEDMQDYLETRVQTLDEVMANEDKWAKHHDEVVRKTIETDRALIAAREEGTESLQDASKNFDRLEATLARIEAPERAFKQGMQDTTELLADGRITIGQYAEELAKLGSALQKPIEKNKQLEQVMNAVRDGVNQVVDAFVNFAVTGKGSIEDLLQSLEKLVLKLLIMQGLQYAFPGLHLGGFATGGDFTVGGAGGTDSQVVAFRATPGERVSVRTPGQQSGEGGGGGSAAPMVVHTHVHMSEDELLQPLSGSRGEAVVSDIVHKRNGAAFALRMRGRF